VFCSGMLSRLRQMLLGFPCTRIPPFGNSLG
jgi:hypothetical protein